MANGHVAIGKPGSESPPTGSSSGCPSQDPPTCWRCCPGVLARLQRTDSRGNRGRVRPGHLVSDSSTEAARGSVLPPSTPSSADPGEPGAWGPEACGTKLDAQLSQGLELRWEGGTPERGHRGALPCRCLEARPSRWSYKRPKGCPV